MSPSLLNQRRSAGGCHTLLPCPSASIVESCVWALRHTPHSVGRHVTGTLPIKPLLSLLCVSAQLAALCPQHMQTMHPVSSPCSATERQSVCAFFCTSWAVLLLRRVTMAAPRHVGLKPLHTFAATPTCLSPRQTLTHTKSWTTTCARVLQTNTCHCTTCLQTCP